MRKISLTGSTATGEHVIARTGVGVDLVDVAAASVRGIPVVITPPIGSRAVAEGVFAMGPAPDQAAETTDGAGAGRPVGRAERRTGRRPDGATLGIVGYGRIGRRVGELAAAFGMRTLAYDPFSPPPSECACADLGEPAESSDVLTPHAPLVESTRHLVDERLLSRVTPGAILIDCGRGGLLDPGATLAVLESGGLSDVGLDMFDPEPALHHPLFDHPDVVLTPHLMGVTRRAMTLTFVDAARGVADVLAGRSPTAVANPHWNHRKATA
ncbi:NAD(P)-dependent oxidoreductase [Streptomyces mirabilis]|uniref:NAD(P)-dependent oxidoreductase n=1 Tax=Streptomyces mirabilis TaxID=68239 RepID=UPI00331AB663